MTKEAPVTVETVGVLQVLERELAKEDCIDSAIVYGSSLIANRGEILDVDTAIMVRSNDGLISREDYRRLKDLRTRVCRATGADIDLVTHTHDEVDDLSSPLYNARYSPSLTHGRRLKGGFPIPSKPIVYQDSARYVLHDNRTITRRQIVRENGPENWRIFISKLYHGPGNVMTYLYNHGMVDQLTNPSDVVGSFEAYDRYWGTDAKSMIDVVGDAKKRVSDGTFTFECGVALLNWYEMLCRPIFLSPSRVPVVFA